MYSDYLLKHGRESRKLTAQQVAERTGIDVKKYEQIETGDRRIDDTDAELLGTLFKIKPEYLRQNNTQMQLLNAANVLMQMDKEKITSLTKALKRKIRTGK